MTEWPDLFEERVRAGEPVELSGEFRGTIMEEIRDDQSTTHFTMQPGMGAEYAPLVDGDPYVFVKLPSLLDDQTMYRMRFACYNNGAVRVIGIYKPDRDGELLGEITASRIEF